MPLFIYRCPKTGYRVQGFSAEDISEDKHVYEAVTCPICHQIHHVKSGYWCCLGRDGRIEPPQYSKRECRLVANSVEEVGQ